MDAEGKYIDRDNQALARAAGDLRDFISNGRIDDSREIFRVYDKLNNPFSRDLREIADSVLQDALVEGIRIKGLGERIEKTEEWERLNRLLSIIKGDRVNIDEIQGFKVEEVLFKVQELFSSGVSHKDDYSDLVIKKTDQGYELHVSDGGDKELIGYFNEDFDNFTHLDGEGWFDELFDGQNRNADRRYDDGRVDKATHKNAIDKLLCDVDKEEEEIKDKLEKGKEHSVKHAEKYLYNYINENRGTFGVTNIGITEDMIPTIIYKGEEIGYTPYRDGYLDSIFEKNGGYVSYPGPSVNIHYMNGHFFGEGENGKQALEKYLTSYLDKKLAEKQEKREKQGEQRKKLAEIIGCEENELLPKLKEIAEKVKRFYYNSESVYFRENYGEGNWPTIDKENIYVDGLYTDLKTISQRHDSDFTDFHIDEVSLSNLSGDYYYKLPFLSAFYDTIAILEKGGPDSLPLIDNRSDYINEYGYSDYLDLYTLVSNLDKGDKEVYSEFLKLEEKRDIIIGKLEQTQRLISNLAYEKDNEYGSNGITISYKRGGYGGYYLAGAVTEVTIEKNDGNLLDPITIYPPIYSLDLVDGELLEVLVDDRSISLFVNNDGEIKTEEEFKEGVLGLLRE